MSLPLGHRTKTLTKKWSGDMTLPDFKDYLAQAKEIESLKKKLRDYQEHICHIESQLQRAHDRLMSEGMTP